MKNVIVITLCSLLIGSGYLTYKYQTLACAQENQSIITKSECIMIKQYKDIIIKTAQKYSTDKLKITPEIIAGLMSRETRVGILVGGCKGYGDNGNGHGLGQADPRGVNLPGPNSEVGTSFNQYTKKYGNETFVWSDCKDGINFIGAHLLSKSEQIQTDYPNVKSNLLLKLTLNAYNAGVAGLARGCLDGSDSCTTGGNYASDVINRANETKGCLDNLSNIDKLVLSNMPEGCQKSSGSSLALFPLKSSKPILYAQPYGQYTSGGAHFGIDLGGNQDVEAVSMITGKIVIDGLIRSQSCTSVCRYTADEFKTQRYVVIEQEDTGSVSIRHVYIHLDPNAKPKTRGDKVKAGDVIGKLDNFQFTHLHFELKLNGVNQAPYPYIKGFGGKVPVVGSYIDMK
jgi:Peptidase family M23